MGIVGGIIKEIDLDKNITKGIGATRDKMIITEGERDQDQIRMKKMITISMISTIGQIEKTLDKNNENNLKTKFILRDRLNKWNKN